MQFQRDTIRFCENDERVHVHCKKIDFDTKTVVQLATILCQDAGQLHALEDVKSQTYCKNTSYFFSNALETSTKDIIAALKKKLSCINLAALLLRMLSISSSVRYRKCFCPIA